MILPQMCSEKPRENQFVRLQNLRGQGRKKVRDEDKVNKWNPSSLSEHTVQKLFQESECRLSLDASVHIQAQIDALCFC